MQEKPKIRVEGFKFRHPEVEHPVPVYIVIIETGKSEWREEFYDELDVLLFIRGVQAGASMAGDIYLEPPEVPKQEHLTEKNHG